MDGGKDAGVLWGLFVRSMNERGTWEAVRIEQATEQLAKLYAPILGLKGDTGEKAKAAFAGAINAGKVDVPGVGAGLTLGTRLSVALNWGNEANRQRLLSGFGWSEAQARAVMQTLTREELHFVNQAWEYLDSFWPEVAAKKKRLTGVEPEKVQAAPFSVALPDGSVVDMRGGYYTIKYDPGRHQRPLARRACSMYRFAPWRAGGAGGRSNLL